MRDISSKIATAPWGDKRRSEFRREFSFIAPQRGLMGARGSGYCAQQTFWIRLPGRPEAERNASEGTTYLKNQSERTDKQQARLPLYPPSEHRRIAIRLGNDQPAIGPQRRPGSRAHYQSSQLERPLRAKASNFALSRRISQARQSAAGVSAGQPCDNV